MDNYSLLLGLHLQTGFCFSIHFSGFDLSLCLLGAVAEAVGLIAGFNDVAVMGEPVQQCRGHLGITEDSGPLGKRQVGGDQNAGVLIEFGQQMEQQCSTGLAEWQVSKFIQNDQVHAHQAHGYAPRISLGLLLLQRIDQIHRRVEPDTFGMVRQPIDSQRRCQVTSFSLKPSRRRSVLQR